MTISFLHINCSDNRSQFVYLSLIVKDLSFLFRSLLGFELSSNCRISSCNEDGLCWPNNRFRDNLCSNMHHNHVGYARVCDNFKFALPVNVTNSHQHIFTWNSYMIKSSPSIIVIVITHFCSNVSSFDTWEPFPSICVTYLNHERLCSIVFLSNYASCHYNCMTRMIS